MSGQTRRFKDSRFTGEEDEEEIDGCVAGTAGTQIYQPLYYRARLFKASLA